MSSYIFLSFLMVEGDDNNNNNNNNNNASTDGFLLNRFKKGVLFSENDVDGSGAAFSVTYGQDYQ